MNQEEREALTQRQAAEKMRVSDRWVRKPLGGMKTGGDSVVCQGCGAGRRNGRSTRPCRRVPLEY